MSKTIRIVAGVGVAVVVAGCSSSGTVSSGSGTPATGVAAIPTPTNTSLPTVTESFTLLPCPAHPQSTLDIEGCDEHQIITLDKRINEIAEAIYGQLSDAAAKDDLVTAQTTWITYRRHACQSESDVYAGGTLASVVAASCTVRLGHQRVTDLATMEHELNSG